jgi:hypothetical protein
MKYNPFKPNGFVGPGMFSGRYQEIKTIEHCLFQAKSRNPTHFLVQGERGIGKTSLLYLASLLGSGQIAMLDGTKVNFLVVSCDLGNAETQLDIIRAIALELKQSIAAHDEIKDRAKAFWDWLTNWEVLGVRYHKERDAFDPTDAAATLVGQIATFCAQAADSIDGILFLVDEADRPDASAHLGAFCKLFTERLEKRSCNTVLLGLAGLPPLLSRLRASHESSPRIFTTMTLEPLLPEEREHVVERGLEEARRKNGGRITEIKPDALRMISTLSEGYPHFIQEFAYAAFAADSDDVIDVADVAAGAYEENGALWQLGEKYFSEMYKSKIASDRYRVVLDTMATHGDQWVSRKDLIAESKLPPTIVTNALNALKGRKIIFADESRKNQGYYRLPTRSFAAWINAVKSVGAERGAELSFQSDGPSDEGRED